MSDARLQDRLAEVTSRIRRLRLYRGLAWGWLAGMMVALVSVLVLGVPTAVAAVAGLSLAIVWGVWSAWPQATDLREAAQRVEARYPELDSRLLTAVDQQPQVGSGIFGYLQMVVLGDVLKHARQQDWRSSLPARRLWGAQLLQLGALALFITAITLVSRHREQIAAAVGLPAPGELLANGGIDEVGEVRVTPGDVEIERGSGLLVTAEFGRQLPGRVELVASNGEQQETRIPLVKSLDDPLFGGRLPEVATDLTYRVEFDDGRSRDFKVTTFEFPRLEQADAEVTSPSYTGMPPEHVPDVRRLSVVEGAEIRLSLRLNKPIALAQLNAEDQPPLSLTAVPDQPRQLTVTLSPTTSQTFALRLADDAGRENKDPVEFVVDVIPNRPPEIKLAFPAKDQKVSPLQEVAFEGEAWDDFGLAEHGLILEKPDGTAEQLVLGRTAQANARSRMTHQLNLEPLGVSPDDLVSYYFYADDVGPDGQPRRAFSDMFFAEVRPFEETFRQAPNQPSNGEGSPCKKLIQLQRQVVSGAWNLIRREPADPPRETFTTDATTLSDSQRAIKDLAEQFAAELEDLLLQQYAAEAIEHMDAAQRQFAVAADKTSIVQLPEGRDAARRAYATLLKLQAREHAVRNPSPSQGAPGEQGRNLTEQIKALELKNDRHRYEMEQQAQQEQDAAAREALQVLNRLRDLARRQEDLNERIRQLENQLREARTDAQRQELQRQLKRLQQEQQDLLRDVDELRERMNREENRPRMAEAREALDKTRERVFQSSEALKQEQTSQALAEGTRAQRELDQLKEQIREQTAGQFDEQLRELRAEARELAETQEQIGRQLQGEEAPSTDDTATPKRERPSLREQPSLRTASTVQNREESALQLADQEQRLKEMLQQMRSIVESAETSEPLLSKRLYDAMRDARVDKPEEALAAAAELVRRGFEQPAREAEEQARAGISKLKEGIEQAAQSVLGNESEALRRAREDLALLTESVARELAENDRQFAREQPQQQSTPLGQRQADRRESKPRTPADASERQPQPRQTGESTGRSNPSEDQPPQPNPQAPQEKSPPGTRTGPGQPSAPPQQPGQSPGDRGQNNQPGPQTGEPSQQSGEPSQQASRQPGQPSQPGQSGQQPGQQGQPSPSGQPTPSGQQGQEGQQDQSGRENSPSQSPPSSSDASSQPSATAQAGGSGGGQPTLQERLTTSLANQTYGGVNGGPVDPLTGANFVEWSDRLRDVEEMLDEPRTRAEVAAIRERAREMRIEFKRHSKQPDWELVRTNIYGPMRELEQRLADELARLDHDERLVPIDRDPVPDQYAELVKRYYQELSRQP